MKDNKNKTNTKENNKMSEKLNIKNNKCCSDKEIQTVECNKRMKIWKDVSKIFAAVNCSFIVELIQKRADVRNPKYRIFVYANEPDLQALISSLSELTSRLKAVFDICHFSVTYNDDSECSSTVLISVKYK